MHIYILYIYTYVYCTIVDSRQRPPGSILAGATGCGGWKMLRGRARKPVATSLIGNLMGS